MAGALFKRAAAAEQRWTGCCLHSLQQCASVGSSLSHQILCTNNPPYSPHCARATYTQNAYPRDTMRMPIQQERTPRRRVEVISGTSSPGTGPAPKEKHTTYDNVPIRAMAPEAEANCCRPSPALMASMDSPMPVKLSVSSCLRPALSMRKAATTVPSTLMAPPPAQARAPDVKPACDSTAAKATQGPLPSRLYGHGFHACC